jgi:hypothetical protein
MHGCAPRVEIPGRENLVSEFTNNEMAELIGRNKPRHHAATSALAKIFRIAQHIGILFHLESFLQVSICFQRDTITRYVYTDLNSNRLQSILLA